MKNYILMGITVALMNLFIGVQSTVLANEITRAEFMKVTEHMMIKPCTIGGYMKCLGIKQEFCQKAVHASFAKCDDKVPGKINRSKVQDIINSYGKCMTGQITQRMKLTPDKLNKCEHVLRANMQQPGAMPKK
ncbi:MAG: hypothetical protein OEZ33_10140 [Gammaproteobacteria bacterium]|nr:hypothetical protein [Gammaproteobacteria bacterium]MDH5778562.1 hypothetical protein [Gammaproteobacteria bacterium]